jgi:hypothetical protein
MPPFSLVTASAQAGARALRRVEASAMRPYADPLHAQAVLDRQLLTDSSILSPYATTVDDVFWGFAADQTASAAARVTDDAVQQALLDAPIPTAFPTDATDGEESFARFVHNLSSTYSAQRPGRERRTAAWEGEEAGSPWVEHVSGNNDDFFT